MFLSLFPSQYLFDEDEEVRKKKPRRKLPSNAGITRVRRRKAPSLISPFILPLLYSFFCLPACFVREALLQQTRFVRRPFQINLIWLDSTTLPPPAQPLASPHSTSPPYLLAPTSPPTPVSLSRPGSLPCWFICKSIFCRSFTLRVIRPILTWGCTDTHAHTKTVHKGSAGGTDYNTILIFFKSPWKKWR